MHPSKILIGQFALVLIIIVLTLWGATQYAAWQLGFQPALGRAWFLAGDWPVYRPWRLFQWWYAYDAYAPDIFARAGLIAASGGLLGFVASVAGSVLRSRWDAKVTTYGSARWAVKADLTKAKLLGGDGVFLGQWQGEYLRHDGPEHVFAFAPTRSGKGVGLVVPTLLSWTGSAIIHDIKGENWELTSGWRSTLGPCIRFDPTDPASPRFNPLMEIRCGINEVRDAQNIADILVDPDGSAEPGNHWRIAAHALLEGVLLHVLYAEEDKSLAGCAHLLTDPACTFDATLERMLVTPHLPGGRVHPEVAKAVRALKNKTDNERSGVLSTALGFLTLYSDPVVAAVTSASDWRIGDLVTGDRPLSLYLVVPPSDISRTMPLMRLMLNQIGRRLTEGRPDPARRRVLMMLDEFPALGRLDFFEKTLAFMAGYGVRAFLIAQSLNQIDKAYGPSNAILDNCHVRVAFATNDERTAKRISDALGTKTELRAQKNYTGHRLSLWLGHMMLSRQETARPLMTPGEVMQMPRGEAVVMVSGEPPIRAKKLKYYRDRNFTSRVLPAAPVGEANVQPETGRSSRAHEAAEAGEDTLEGELAGTGLQIEASLDSAGAKAAPHMTLLTQTEPDPSGRAASSANETIKQAVALDLGDSDLMPGF